jgi:hypothetical protein
MEIKVEKLKIIKDIRINFKEVKKKKNFKYKIN